MHLVDEYHDVVCKHLAESLIGHRGISFAPKEIPEFPLNHAEGTLRIAALVVVLKKLFPLVLEVVEHLLVGSAHSACSRGSQRNVRRSSGTHNGIDAFNAVISLVCRYLRDTEILGGSVHHRREVRTIGGE